MGLLIDMRRIYAAAARRVKHCAQFAEGDCRISPTGPELAASATSAWQSGAALLSASRGQHHDELLAAQPTDDVVLAQASLREAACCLEHVIAAAMPVVVVHFLEEIEIERRGI